MIATIMKFMVIKITKIHVFEIRYPSFSRFDQTHELFFISDNDKRNSTIVDMSSGQFSVCSIHIA